MTESFLPGEWARGAGPDGVAGPGPAAGRAAATAARQSRTTLRAAAGLPKGK